MNKDAEPTRRGKKTEPTFEQALARLDEIVSEMESGKLGLENMVARFEEGRKLLQHCNAKLNEVERKIERLVEKDDGTPATVPFEAFAGDKEPAGAEGGDEACLKDTAGEKDGRDELF